MGHSSSWQNHMEQEKKREHFLEQMLESVLAFLGPIAGCLCSNAHLTASLSLPRSPSLQGQGQVSLAIKWVILKTDKVPKCGIHTLLLK